jgi:hypothetical protein
MAKDDPCIARIRFWKFSVPKKSVNRLVDPLKYRGKKFNGTLAVSQTKISPKSEFLIIRK